MSRLSAFQIGQYRGVSGLALDQIAPFNLVTGPNGIGKTSLLEALWLFHGRNHPGNLWASAIQRSHEAVTDPLERLAAGEIQLAGTEGGRKRMWRVAFAPTLNASAGTAPAAAPATNGRRDQEELPAPTAGFLHVWLDGKKQKWQRDLVMTTPRGLVRLPGRETKTGRGILVSAINVLGVADDTVKEFGKLVVSGGKRALIADLRIVLPWVQDVEVVVAESGSSYVLATTEEDVRLPLQALGGGVVRLFHALVAMRTAKTGAIFLDEVEIGLHHSALPDLWRCIRRLATGLDVQVFASTHSSDCVDAAVAVSEESPNRLEDLAVHHLYLQPNGKGIRASTYRGETLLGAREINLELR